MNKKSVIALLISLVLILSVFCGCNKKTDETTTATKETTQSVSLEGTQSTNGTEPDTAGSNPAQSEEYAPAQKDENELEIMTVPPADSQDSSNSQNSADSQKPTIPEDEPDIEDFIPSGEPIELPFVPIV